MDAGTCVGCYNSHQLHMYGLERSEGWLKSLGPHISISYCCHDLGPLLLMLHFWRSESKTDQLCNIFSGGSGMKTLFVSFSGLLQSSMFLLFCSFHPSSNPCSAALSNLSSHLFLHLVFMCSPSLTIADVQTYLWKGALGQLKIIFLFQVSKCDHVHESSR